MRGGVRPDLATTKPDKSAHGFGIAGMPGNCGTVRRLSGRPSRRGRFEVAGMSAASQDALNESSERFERLIAADRKGLLPFLAV